MRAKARNPRRLRRTARLVIGPSKLRRPSDRIEGAVLALLSAAFLACAATAAFLAWSYCQTQSTQAARLHPSVAVVSRSFRAESSGFPVIEADARWRAPDGQSRSGILTGITAPSLSRPRPGTRVQVWLTVSGNLAPAPPGTFASVLNAVVVATATWALAGMVLGIFYLVSRIMLDRRRLAGWESDWALTGPRWTMLR